MKVIEFAMRWHDAGNKIEAIKAVRWATEVGLKAAKEAVETAAMDDSWSLPARWRLDADQFGELMATLLDDGRNPTGLSVSNVVTVQPPALGAFDATR